jgi:hypothetical protein
LPLRSRCVAGSTVGRFAVLGDGAAAKISTALHTPWHGRGARQPDDSGGSRRAHTAAMLAERQRQVPQAKIAEVRDPRPVLRRRSFADTSRR